MAAVIGTIASVLTLFDVCVRSLAFVRDIRHHDIDLQRLTIKLNVQNIRLCTWGESMGLGQHPKSSDKARLAECRCLPTVEAVLKMIVELLNRSEDTRKKYGYQQLGGCQTLTCNNELYVGRSDPGPSAGGSDVLSYQRLPTDRTIGRVRWAIYDKSKFQRLITEAKELINDLYEITNDILQSAAQQRALTRYIGVINDVSDLEAVADICKDDYPAISEAASYRAEALTSHNVHPRSIQDWNEHVQVDEERDVFDTGKLFTQIEDMTVTELKHNLWMASIAQRSVTTPDHTHSSTEIVLAHSADLERFSDAHKTESPPAPGTLSCESLVPISTPSSQDEQHQTTVILAEDPDDPQQQSHSSSNHQLNENHDLLVNKQLLRHTSLSDQEFNELVVNDTTLSAYPPHFYDDRVRFWQTELKAVVRAGLDVELRREQNTVSDWFDALSDDEKTSVMFRLSQGLNSLQVHFFSRILSRRMEISFDEFFGRHSWQSPPVGSATVACEPPETDEADEDDLVI